MKPRSIREHFTGADNSPPRQYSFPIGRLLFWSLLITAAIYVVLLVANWTTRTGGFTADSMNYVNVARNVSAGRGLVSPSLGFNQAQFSKDDQIPTPAISQAPLYPVMIATLSKMGIAPVTGALLLSAIGYGSIFLLSCLVAVALYDPQVGLISFGALLFYYPMRWMKGFAWTDPIGIALMLGSIWLLVKGKVMRRQRLFFVAGIAAGIAFATRYALISTVGIGLCVLTIDIIPLKRRALNAGLFGSGALIPAGLVWANNLLSTGLVMPSYKHPPVRIAEALSDSMVALFESYAGATHPYLQLGSLAVFLVVCLALLSRDQLFESLRDRLVSGQRFILIVGALGYLALLIGTRSRWDFGPDRWYETLRLVAPAGVIVVLLLSAIAAKAARVSTRAAQLFALTSLFVAIWSEVNAGMKKPPIDPSLRKYISASQRLVWVSTYTSSRDLIIGDDTIDIPFFINDRSTVSFSPYPITDYPTYDRVMSYSNAHCEHYDNIYLIIRRQNLTEEDWRANYGDFFTDLVFGRFQKYPDVIALGQLNDAFLFRLRCRRSSTS